MVQFTTLQRTLSPRYCTTKATEYYITTFAATTYYTEVLLCLSYYTTKAAEYYTTNYASATYYLEIPKC
ncbi:hypothetical protein DAPPUDRAFT_255691 [Daphnia pulex]|uniref:Uncharacterized protein n=1 Tax=Daphnia pulex TaxID=6669 RepID=E9H9Y1_DAPPU|nr:hypothetical protein DAPPUDRAFT_255691 [Daphnia pulex]|eukprot:EFX71482.1 hypothetical protein DAPPUDRAFT_255691 [Daphnia pulex]